MIVYLSDDISVGGSQKMLIAKYYNKPLIGLAQKEEKFNKSEKELYGRIFRKYIDPYVKVSCDYVASNVQEAAAFLKELFTT